MFKNWIYFIREIKKITGNAYIELKLTELDNFEIQINWFTDEGIYHFRKGLPIVFIENEDSEFEKHQLDNIIQDLIKFIKFNKIKCKPTTE